MSESKHTPGPWQARFIYRMLKAAREIPGLLFQSQRENDWADACLMAASPDLLSAHEPDADPPGPDFLDWLADRLVNVYGESEDVDFVIALRRKASKARAAIRKATNTTEG